MENCLQVMELLDFWKCLLNLIFCPNTLNAKYSVGENFRALHVHSGIPAEKFRGVVLKCLKFSNIRPSLGVKVSRLPPNARKTRNFSTTEHFAFKVLIAGVN